MSMTQQEMVEMAERLSRIGKGVELVDFMGALGLLMFHCFMEFDREDRLHGVTAWCGALMSQIANAEHKRKAN